MGGVKALEGGVDFAMKLEEGGVHLDGISFGVDWEFIGSSLQG
jgi:hypothetical protein